MDTPDPIIAKREFGPFRQRGTISSDARECNVVRDPIEAPTPADPASD
jgi:hypothetical protein